MRPKYPFMPIISRMTDSPLTLPNVKQFYTKWIANSFSFPGKTIYSLQSGLCITQLKQDILKIDLLSVLEKRKGLGSRLIGHALAQASQGKISYVEVTTESHNKVRSKSIPATVSKKKRGIMPSFVSLRKETQ